MKRLLLLAALIPALASAQSSAPAAVVPAVRDLLDPPGASELERTVERYTADRAALLRRYDTEWSPERRERLRAFYTEWQAKLAATDLERLGVEGRADWVLLDNRVRYELALLDRERTLLDEMRPLLPFAEA